MAAFICFLRGVNVGGKGKVPMADLRALLEGLGFDKVKTLLQSGNAVFAAKGGTATALAGKIEAAIEKRFAYRSDVHLLTPSDLRRIVEANPYPGEAKKDPSHLIVRFIARPIDKTAQAALAATAAEGEKFKVTPGAIFLYYAHGIARSKLGSTLDRKDGARGTGRNWNTVTKLLDLAEAL
jgi:uncharacterized protein (DUF1697 family)